MYRFQYLILLFLAPVSLMAQERLVALHSNHKVMAEAKKMQANHTFKRTQSFSADTLPFLDDFSKPGPYPDTTWWIDKKVYVNYGSPLCPPTLGVATFDGLDSIGFPYFPSNSPYASVPSDMLTSRPISWVKNKSTQSYGLGDSIYLSFYFQAGSYFGKDSKGNGQLFYFPGTNDTLLLQFRAAGSITWNTIWYHLGYSAPDTDSTFHMVMIGFHPGAYFSSVAELNTYMADGFQFRFLAYSSGTADADHWNIDEVYLNANRGWSDTTQNDLTFSYEAPPLLANYSQEPWEQFEPADWRTTPMGLFERNNNASALPSSPGNVINATYSNTVFGTLNSGGANNIDPFVDAGYNNYAPQSQPMLNTSAAPTTLTGDTSFTITHILQHGNGIPADDFNNWNDTLRYTQVFDNAYAYDDGSAEYAYYINRQNSGSVPSYLAYQFTLNKPDSIFGLSIYFDYVFVTNTTYTFKITLWSDKGGMPGDTLYQDTVTNPIYSHLGNDEFSTFYFKYPKILPAGPFYVGWEQTAGDSMNIGFDYNSGDHSSKLYYTTTYISPSNAGWQQSSFPGTLMLRPLMGNASKYVGINSIEAPKTDIVLYPNPAQNSVTLGGDIRNAAVRIVGADGRVLYEDDNFSGNTVNTSFLPNGFYIVQITPKGKETVFKKLLISK